MMPDWSQLPEELLHLISKNLEDYCFDVIHARSVCRSWRSTFPYPSYLLRTRESLPNVLRQGFCTLKKVPLFLFRVLTPVAAALPYEYILGGIGRDESEDHTELTFSSVQCSVKLKISGSDPIVMNMLDLQILSLGYKVRMIGREREHYRGVAFHPLSKKRRRGEFVVLSSYCNMLMVLTSGAEMRWKPLRNNAYANNLTTYRGRFFVTFRNGRIKVIDPYSLEVTPMMMLQPVKGRIFLVPSGDDALFLVNLIIPPLGSISDFSLLTCKVSRLDEEAGKWVEVSDLGDRVLFIGQLGNVSCSAKELPYGCDLSRNSILFTHEDNATCAYKYENLRNCWIYSKVKHGILNLTY